MDRIVGVRGVEVGYDHDFEERWVRIVRIVWLLLALFLAAGVAGLLGKGPVANSVARNANLVVHYEKLLRFKTPSYMRLETAVPGPDALEMRVTGTCSRVLQISQVIPPPVASQVLQQGAAYNFKAPSAGDVDVVFGVQPQKLGPAVCRIEAGNAAVELHQFVLP